MTIDEAQKPGMRKPFHAFRIALVDRRVFKSPVSEFHRAAPDVRTRFPAANDSDLPEMLNQAVIFSVRPISKPHRSWGNRQGTQ